MKTRRSLILILLVTLLMAVTYPSPTSAIRNQHPEQSEGQKTKIESPQSISGLFLVLWDDPQPGELPSSGPAYFLHDDAGRSIQLFLSADLLRAHGGVLALDRRRITVTGQWLSNQAIAVQSVQLDPTVGRASPNDIVGPQPWVSVLCKFADVPAEPHDVSYFVGMYGSTYPGLDHYWREVSYDIANVTGSAVAGWYVLPQPRSHYVYDQDGDGEPELDWNRAANDCTDVADPDVYYPDFVGINLMFNDLLDCCAWGGGWYDTLDGVSRLWYMTWEPPWGYGNVGVIAHEMGHGFGLPHSSGNYGQTYDNQWDVMSDVWSNCSNSSDPVYGCLGQHTISYHKDLLGWVAPGLEFVVPTGTHATLTLEQLALPETSNYLMARIPIADSTTRFYTVEARRKVGYDVKLPGEAVIIHEVDPARDNDAHVIDIDGNGNTGDAGAMWVPGESFVDDAAGITVSVLSATPTGWVIGVENRIVSLTSLTLDGPAGCTVGAGCSLLATVTPITASLPITYVWEATGQPPVTHVGGLVDPITYTWDVTGTQVITVSATNGRQPLVATHSLTTDLCLARIASQPGITYTVVQAAVDAANPGDVVQVAGYCTGVGERAGLTQAVYLDKEITLRGGYNPADWSVCDPLAHPTTLDAQGLGRVVYVTGSAQNQPLLDGLILTGGDADELGGGLNGRDAGGGLYAVTAAPTISGCHLTDNTAQEGGGAFLSYSPATFSQTTISANVALYGGGIYLEHSAAALHANLIEANTATANGGGLFLRYSPAALSANRIEDNTAATFGGGIYMTYSQSSLTNDVVADNHCTYQGSGLYTTYSSPQLHHATIARNTGGNGSGLYITISGAPTLRNAIIAGQATGIIAAGGCSANVDGVLWFDNQANTGGPGTVTVQHAVSGDPAFAADGYHLSAGSAALDAGVTVDIDGDSRSLCFGYDLGADELLPTLPEAAFTSSSPDWLGQTTTFTNTTAALCAAYLWDFGDGTSSAEASPVHSYTTPGLYTVTLTATAPGAGADAASNPVTIYGPPVVAISAQPDHGHYPLLVTFTPAVTTIPPGDPTLAYLWAFGDGLTSTLLAPTHTYTLPGLYNATLTVANPAGQTAAAIAILVADSELYLPLVVRSSP